MYLNNELCLRIMPLERKQADGKSEYVILPRLVYDWLKSYERVFNKRGVGSTTLAGFDAWMRYNFELIWCPRGSQTHLHYSSVEDAYLRTHRDSILANTIRRFLNETAETEEGKRIISDLYTHTRAAHEIMVIGLLGKLDGRSQRKSLSVVVFAGKNLDRAVFMPFKALKSEGEVSIVDPKGQTEGPVFAESLRTTFVPYSCKARVTWGASAMPKTATKRGRGNKEEEPDSDFTSCSDIGEGDDTDHWVREPTGKGEGSVSAPAVMENHALKSFRRALKIAVRTAAQPNAGGGKSRSKGSAPAAKSRSTGSASGVKTVSVIAAGVSTPIIDSGAGGLAPISTPVVALAAGPGLDSGGITAPLAPQLPAAGAVAVTPRLHGSDVRGTGSADPADASRDDRLRRAVDALLTARDSRAAEIVGGMVSEILPGTDGALNAALLTEAALSAIHTLRTMPGGAYEEFLKQARLVEPPRSKSRPRGGVTAKEKDAYFFSAQGVRVRTILDEMTREGNDARVTDPDADPRRITDLDSGEGLMPVRPTVPGFDMDAFLVKNAELVKQCNHGDLYRNMFREICMTLGEPLLILIFMQKVTGFSPCAPANFGFRAVKALDVAIDYYTFLKHPTTYLQSGICYDIVEKKYTPLENHVLFQIYAPIDLKRFYLDSVDAYQTGGMPGCCARYLAWLDVVDRREYTFFKERMDKDDRMVEWLKRDTPDKFTPREYLYWQLDKTVPAIIVKQELPSPV